MIVAQHIDGRTQVTDVSLTRGRSYLIEPDVAKAWQLGPLPDAAGGSTDPSPPVAGPDVIAVSTRKGACVRGSGRRDLSRLIEHWANQPTTS